MISFLTFLWASAVLATPASKRAAGPTVSIQHGTVIGTSLLGIDSFKGIPYAQPPVGDLRLKPPQPITSSLGTINAVGTPNSCPQMTSSLDTSNLPGQTLNTLLNSPLVQKVTSTGEDCLTLNVQRPANTKSNAKLPVVFWIYGGGFEAGSTQMYDGSNFIKKSVSLQKPVIYVAVNYRVGGFGFLAGKELASEGSTNLGLRDQRLGMQWVRDNIVAFGGDPDKVTIWGESAGAISVFDHTIINGGDNTYKGKPLFRGAIMNSGSVVPTDPVTTHKAQDIFDTVVNVAGCSGASNALTCLRDKDYPTFLNAVNSVPGIFSYRSVDLSYLPRPDPGNNFFSQSPEIPVKAGRYAKVPIIVGDQEDEGTLFSLVQSNITNSDELVQYLASYFPTNPNAMAAVRGLAANYPDQPLAGQPSGSPFRTAGLNNIYPEFKRLAAILGDITFTLTRRASYLDVVSSQVKAFSYLNSYFYGLPVLGTGHGLDILIMYGTLTNLPHPTSTTQEYYINFINDLDVNSGGSLDNWPQYSTKSRQILNFLKLDNKIITDNFRQSASNYLATSATPLRV